MQLPQTQFFKGKSYRGFCPIGPWLTVLEPEEFAYLDATRTATLGQRDRSPERHDKESRVQACRNDFGAVDIRQRRAGRRAADRNAQRLRASRAAPADPPRLLQLLPERQFWNLFLKARAAGRNICSPETGSTPEFAAPTAGWTSASR